MLFAALANTQGGHVIFGIKDNKEFQGYELTNEEFKIFEQSLVNIAHDKLSPPINLKEIQKISCEEGDVLLINIPIRKMGNPCSVDGILHMRHGSHNQPVIDSTIRKRLYDENETLIDEKDKVISTNNLEDIEIDPLWINNNPTPYYHTKSTGRANCFVFGSSQGFFDGSYYTHSNQLFDIKCDELGKILKSFYSTFGPPNIFNTPGFNIHQGDNAWFGFGPINFIKALKEQKVRYKAAGIQRSHHREIAGYIDDRYDLIFYVGSQPNVGKSVSSDYLEIGFVFPSMPFDNRKILEFYDNAGLEGPEFIPFDKDYLKPKYKDLVSSEIKLEKIGEVVHESGIGHDTWISKVLCKNPLYRRNSDSSISQHEEIIINLGQHHLINDDVHYTLIEFCETPIPYQNFNFSVLNYQAEYVENL
ncbi:MAG TPA: ATP-binding protein [Candidatus Marinimicrobia bacterium]|nr:ATP-binding protein [Candidatus Neomarinimicrobiota bacterium]